MNQTFMKEKKILPLVLSMSLPMVISMAVNSLYNIVDSYFVAKMSEQAMTALALVYPVQNLITSIGVGFGVGINANVAFYLGAGKQEQAEKSATLGLALSFVHGVVLMVLSILGMPLFLRLFTSDQEVTRLALIYADRAFLFSVIITLGISFEKIFQSVGRMKVSMFSMVCGFAANIVLDPLMIFGMGPFPEMGIAGAAYATGIGQCISLAVYMVIHRVRPVPVRFTKKNLRWDGKVVKRMYAIGVPATLNMGLTSVQVAALNGILAGFSQQFVLVLGVYYKLQTFIYLTASGIVQGIRPLISYNYGAGEKKRVKEIYRTSLRLAVVVMVAGTLLSWIIPEQLIGLFTENAETVAIGTEALRIISIGFIISAVSVISSGALEGLGLGTSSLCIALGRYVVVIVPMSFVLSRFLGAQGVWWAFVVTEFVMAGVSWWLYRKHVSDHKE